MLANLQYTVSVLQMKFKQFFKPACNNHELLSRAGRCGRAPGRCLRARGVVVPTYSLHTTTRPFATPQAPAEKASDMLEDRDGGKDAAHRGRGDPVLLSGSFIDAFARLEKAAAAHDSTHVRRSHGVVVSVVAVS